MEMFTTLLMMMISQIYAPKKIHQIYTLMYVICWYQWHLNKAIKMSSIYEYNFCLCVYLCGYVEATIDITSLHQLFCILFIEPGVMDFDRLAGQWALEIPMSLFSSPCTKVRQATMLSFYMGTGIQSQVLMLVWQALYRQLSFRPHKFFLIVLKILGTYLLVHIAGTKFKLLLCVIPYNVTLLGMRIDTTPHFYKIRVTI